jgi:hypothetical protein
MGRQAEKELLATRQQVFCISLDIGSDFQCYALIAKAAAFPICSCLDHSVLSLSTFCSSWLYLDRRRVLQNPTCFCPRQFLCTAFSHHCHIPGQPSTEVIESTACRTHARTHARKHIVTLSVTLSYGPSLSPSPSPSPSPSLSSLRPEAWSGFPNRFDYVPTVTYPFLQNKLNNTQL